MDGAEASAESMTASYLLLLSCSYTHLQAPAARPANGTEKARGTPSTLSGSPDDGRQRANGPPASTPTAPRAQSNAVNGSSHVSQAQLTSTSTKLAMERYSCYHEYYISLLKGVAVYRVLKLLKG